MLRFRRDDVATTSSASTGTGHRRRGPVRPPRNALRRFTPVRHHDTSMASFRPALTEAPAAHDQAALGTARSIPGPRARSIPGPRPCLFDVGFPLSGLQDRTHTSDLCPAHPLSCLTALPPSRSSRPSYLAAGPGRPRQVRNRHDAGPRQRRSLPVRGPDRDRSAREVARLRGDGARAGDLVRPARQRHRPHHHHPDPPLAQGPRQGPDYRNKLVHDRPTPYPRRTQGADGRLVST
jgi:hypothetical protein